MDLVNLKLINIKSISNDLDYIISYINQDRLEKANKIINKNAKTLSLGASYLLKKYLGNYKILESDKGKPFIEDGPFFNISHSKEFVVLGISDKRDIGVDIEFIKDNNIDAIKYVLNDDEKNTDNIETLFQYWTSKESLVKCLSTGISDMHFAPALPLNGPKTFRNEKYYTKTTTIYGYSLSITLKGDEPFEVIIDYVDVV